MAYLNPVGPAFKQGDVVANVRTFALKGVEGETATGVVREYAYSVVVTQDCDLEQDHRARFPSGEATVSADKLLFGVLLCGAYDEDAVKAGAHRTNAKKFARSEWKPVLQNQDPRFQFIGYVPQVGLRLVVDFKDYFMVPCPFLYTELVAQRVRRLAEMESPYKEHMLQRFAWYLMRVPLPVDFDALPTTQEV